MHVLRTTFASIMCDDEKRFIQPMKSWRTCIQLWLLV